MPNVKDEHYGDEKKLLFALADALRDEYKTIVDRASMCRSTTHSFPICRKSCARRCRLRISRMGELRIDALNRALDGIRRRESRYHICWGSWSGPHAFDVPLKDIVDIMLQVNVGAYQFEAANVRHEHEWKVWKTAKLPAGKMILPGVISHATNVLEHPELVAERLVRFANMVGRDNVMAWTDCGFAQSPFARRVHRSIMWAKLKSLVEGARIASGELWGRRSAA